MVFADFVCFLLVACVARDAVVCGLLLSLFWVVWFMIGCRFACCLRLYCSAFVLACGLNLLFECFFAGLVAIVMLFFCVLIGLWLLFGVFGFFAYCWLLW